MTMMTQEDWFVQHLAGFYQEKAGWFDPADIAQFALDAACVARDAQRKLLVQLVGRGHGTCGGALQANFDAVLAGVSRWDLGCERFGLAIDRFEPRAVPVPDGDRCGDDQTEGYLNLILGDKQRS